MLPGKLDSRSAKGENFIADMVDLSISLSENLLDCLPSRAAYNLCSSFPLTRMPNSRPFRLFRRLPQVMLCLLVLASFLGAQVTAAIDDHGHGGPDHHCCAGCHPGHFPLLPVLSGVQVAALPVSGWRQLPNEADPVSAFRLSFHPSRAPPA